MDFFAMMKEQEKKEKKSEEKTNKKENVSIKATESDTDTKEQKDTQLAKDDKKAPKTQNKAKKEDAKKTETTYKYPFSLYSEGRTIDISNYGFEDGKEYTEKEITEIMLNHRHYEFAGEMTYKMFADDNVLVATAKQYKKG